MIVNSGWKLHSCAVLKMNSCLFLTTMLASNKCKLQSSDLLVARGEAKRNPGLGVWHDAPSASKFSEVRFSIFRTEDENEDEKMRRWDCRGGPAWLSIYSIPWDLRISARSACFFAYSRSVAISVRLFSSAIDDRSNAGCIAVRRSQIMYPNMNM